ncbi:beta-ketoacyl synthase N-terminal-like domain-containing protein [Crocosphaera sp. UHCC 0190]|uniref:beta-ketoacyl synthase N-terminal-like domain-containing protein n=1 Tax=Crocosphaera sp. UHCC 0190 TaxID=3110246 RepID=UPI002B1F08B0|nr:beta-ketoacyl synthase N-terminal-like domain-containing protein [Crocosphaera sp. UHCC 0190]MEA5510000.1 beta-ketoacyl synthase N-terminal-like domain-containing protein [Crocosphaera sp. UHCC 0190]
MEPIAIIGLSCRFPSANDPQHYWQLLRNGIDAITEVPPDRWDIESLYEETPATPGKMNTKWGGFLKEIDAFDAEFFRISPREAEYIDPQQRLLLEVAWEALENGGLIPKELAESQTGVFVGISNNDYGRASLQDISKISAYSGTGNALCITANRLSYLLNLKGPSLAIDTACSSSLVAVHYACQSLRLQESDLCLAGGVNLILSPEGTIIFSQARMMASDGHCKTFDARADGYVRGEGCGIVVLKRLSDALRGENKIYAVIKGSAVNQDGLTNGLTAPNGPSQQAVIRQALKNAGVKANQISYIEAHGTGTPLGDPQEFNSLKKVLMENRQPDQPCWIGSVKTNIGHLESAAGIAGLIKVVLSLQHQEIPQHLNLQQLNPYISVEGTPLRIPLQCEPWETPSEKRLAGISAFGFGGTNCHLIVEEAPQTSETLDAQSSSQERPYHLLTLSAKTEPALLEMANRYQTFLASHPDISVADIYFSANTGRSQFEHRLAIVTDTSEDLQRELAAFAHQEESNGISGIVTSRKAQKIAFLFTGQGSQYEDMGRQLYETQPRFREILDRCDQILRPYLDKPLLEILYPREGQSSPIHETAYTQPALFALEYALAQLWQSWGIKPDVVMGHSVGEYVAACVAGLFSLEDGLKLIAQRGRLMQALPQDGSMMAVLADETKVKAVLQPYGQEVVIAAYNGPQSIVISGLSEVVTEVQAIFESEGIKTKPLQVSHAFHSPAMEPMLEEFRQIAQEITYHQPQINIISNVTGQLASQDIGTPEYWCLHILQPVRFAESMETLAQQGYEVFLEIGPKPILLGMGRHCLPEQAQLWLPSLRPEQENWLHILNSLAMLYVRGININWSKFDQDYVRRPISLPTYPFQRKRYWLDTDSSKKLTPTVSTSNLVHQILLQQLQTVGNFSDKEVKLLPRLVDVLLTQAQPSSPSSSVIEKNQNLSTSTESFPETSKTDTKPSQSLTKTQLLQADPQECQELLQSYLGKLLGKVTKIPANQIDWQQPLSSLGIDSLMATEIRKELEMTLEIAVPVEYFAALTIEQFFDQVLHLITSQATHRDSEPELNREKQTQQDLWFPFLDKNSQPRLRLFCFPYAGAGASIFQSWSKFFPSDIEICPVQLPGRENRDQEPPFTGLKPLIQTLVPLICPYLDRPFAFFGHSMGALLSFELTRELRRQNKQSPVCLFVSSSRAPQIPDFDVPLHQLGDSKFKEALQKFQGIPEETLKKAEFDQQFLPILRADFALMETYLYGSGDLLNCPIYAFGGVDDRKVSQKDLESWSQQTSQDFRVKMFSGEHFFFQKEQPEMLQIVWQKISEYIDS